MSRTPSPPDASRSQRGEDRAQAAGAAGDEDRDGDGDEGGASRMLRALPIVAILAVAVAGAFLLRDRLGFEALEEHREALLAFRDAHYLLAALGFVAAYAALVAFSLPGALVFTLTGGFLFGIFPGILYNVAGASIGAIVIFLAARTGFGARFARKVDDRGGKIASFKRGLKEDEWSYLFLMRLVPVLPFFVANLLPAFAGTSLLRFAVSTVIGITPGGLVYTSVGAGLGDVFASGERPDAGIIFEPVVLGPLLGLAALAVLPVAVKRYRRSKGD